MLLFYATFLTKGPGRLWAGATDIGYLLKIIVNVSIKLCILASISFCKKQEVN